MTETENRAISLYEQGAEKEAIGLMRDAIILYQSALRADRDVEKKYRKRLMDQFAINNKASSPHDSVLQLGEKIEELELSTDQDDGDLEDVQQLDPCWLLDILPDDLLMQVVSCLIHTSPTSHLNFALTCRRLAELSFSSEAYKHLCHIFYPQQHYSSVSIQLNNISRDQVEMVRNWDFQWEKMLNDRPFLKYQGVYISKVSYISDGANAYSYYAPVKVVTYFRYLRFLPDGRVLKLTTTDEPSLVVAHMEIPMPSHWSNAHVSRYDLTLDGLVTIHTHTDRYQFGEELNIVNLGDRKYHRLKWESSYIIRDNEREYFNLKKERPFNFSRVASYVVKHDTSC